jgi:hypothetical protein
VGCGGARSREQVFGEFAAGRNQCEKCQAVVKGKDRVKKEGKAFEAALPMWWCLGSS